MWMERIYITGPTWYITIKDGLDRFFEKYDGF
jgi:hypothetical protein